MPRAALVPEAAADTRLDLLGVPVDRCTRQQALEHCARALRGELPAQQLVTLNPEMVMQARRRPELARAIRSAGLVLADGAGVSWASRRLGAPVPERIPGVDFLIDLAALSSQEGGGCFMLGAALGVAEEAARRVQGQRPEVVVRGTLPGSPREAEAPEICQRVRASGAALLVVAFGVPAQDLWLERHLGESGARLGIGVGGSLDYLAGRVPRAPELMRRLGLEWLFRLFRQPWRLPRMLRGAPFFWLTLQAARGRRT